MPKDSFDLICLGRAAVDLYGDQLGSSLEAVQTFTKSLGGCAANIAVCAARQGLKVSMLSRVGDEQMGRFVRSAFEKEGIDVSHLSTDPECLTALVLLSIRDQESFPHIFYRHDCADMAVKTSHVSEEYIASSRGVLLTGTHLSQPGVAELSLQVAEWAQRHHRKVILDIDFRPVLWGLTGHADGEARAGLNSRVSEQLSRVLPFCQLVAGTEEEFQVLGDAEDSLEALKRVRSQSSATLVLKRGPQGCVVFPEAIPASMEEGTVCPPQKIEVLNTLGAGDAFLGTFIANWLQDKELLECGTRANAAGALVAARHGCAPAMPSVEELDYFLLPDRPQTPVLSNETLGRLHRHTRHLGAAQELLILAFDHRGHFDRLAAQSGAAPERVSQLKELIAAGGQQALEQVSIPRAGMIIDGDRGRQALSKMSDSSCWLARPIERPDYRPLAFEGGLKNVDARLRTWPHDHVVKCLVQYHPDADKELRTTQKRRLKRLYDACERWDRTLLLEVLPKDRNGEPDEAVVPRAVERLYQNHIYPDWWKLPAMASDEDWQKISRIIQTYDPGCRGVLILGNAAREETLQENFQLARKYPLCRGFAVGRTIFSGPSARWLADALDDQGLKDQICANFVKIIHMWQQAEVAKEQRKCV